jgi:hypothetical protein
MWLIIFNTISYIFSGSSGLTMKTLSPRTDKGSVWFGGDLLAKVGEQARKPFLSV